MAPCKVGSGTCFAVTVTDNWYHCQNVVQGAFRGRQGCLFHVFQVLNVFGSVLIRYRKSLFRRIGELVRDSALCLGSPSRDDLRVWDFAAILGQGWVNFVPYFAAGALKQAFSVCIYVNSNEKISCDVPVYT